jgi:alanyl-tRNA synthetase
VQVTGDKKGYTNMYGAADTDSHDMAYRVIADHIRTYDRSPSAVRA